MLKPQNSDDPLQQLLYPNSNRPGTKPQVPPLSALSNGITRMPLQTGQSLPAQRPSLMDAITKPSPPPRIGNPFLPSTGQSTIVPRPRQSVPTVRPAPSIRPLPMPPVSGNPPLNFGPKYREIGLPRWDANGYPVVPPNDGIPRRYFINNGVQFGVPLPYGRNLTQNDVDTVYQTARQQAALDREQYLAPRDPDFEKNVQDFTDRFLANENDSAPYRALQSARNVPVAEAGRAVPIAYSPISRVAILRKIREENGTGLTNGPAVAKNLSELGVPYKQGLSPAGKPAIVPDIGSSASIPDYRAENQIKSLQNLNDLLEQLTATKAELGNFADSNFPTAFQSSADRDAIATLQARQKRLETVLHQYGVYNPIAQNPFSRLANAAIRYAAQNVAGSVIGTDAALDKARRAQDFWQLNGSLPEGTWQNTLINGYDDYVGSLHGLEGFAARTATGFVQPENLALMGILGTADVAGGLAASNAESLAEGFANPTVIGASDVARTAANLERWNAVANTAHGLGEASARFFQAQGMAGALESLGRFNPNDPFGSAADIGMNLVQAIAPEAHLDPYGIVGQRLNRLGEVALSPLARLQEKISRAERRQQTLAIKRHYEEISKAYRALDDYNQNFRDAGIGVPKRSTHVPPGLERLAPLRLAEPATSAVAEGERTSASSVPRPFSGQSLLSQDSTPFALVSGQLPLEAGSARPFSDLVSWLTGKDTASNTAGAANTLNVPAMVQNEGRTWPRLSDLTDAATAGSGLNAESNVPFDPSRDPTHDLWTSTGRIPVGIVGDSLYKGHTVVQDENGNRANVPSHRLEPRTVPETSASGTNVVTDPSRPSPAPGVPYESIPLSHIGDLNGPLMSLNGEWPLSVNDYAIERDISDTDGTSIDDNIRHLFDDKRYGAKKIVKALDMSRRAVEQRLEAMKESLRPKRPVAPKISDAIRQEIVDKYNKYKQPSEIARDYNIEPRTVQRIVAEDAKLRSRDEARMLREDTDGNNTHGIQSKYISTKSDLVENAGSSYEVARMHQLDNDPTVAFWWKSSDWIPYDFEGKIHKYNPDLHIIYQDGRHVVEEVKPANLVGTPKVQSKARYAQPFYNKRGVEYRLITDNDIGLDYLRNFDYDSLATTNLKLNKPEIIQELKDARKDVAKQPTYTPKTFKELLAGDNDSGTAGSFAQYPGDSGSPQNGSIDLSRAGSGSGVTSVPDAGGTEATSRSGGGSTSRNQSDNSGARPQQSSLGLYTSPQGTRAEPVLNPDFTKNYIAAAYHNLMPMRMPVRALFKDTALARMSQEAPLDILDLPVFFDPYLSDKKMAVTRVHSFESGNRVEIRINPRVAQDAETLAFCVAHEVGHCADLLTGRLSVRGKGNRNNWTGAEDSANAFAERIVGYKKPNLATYTLRLLPADARFSIGNDVGEPWPAAYDPRPLTEYQRRPRLDPRTGTKR